MSMSCGCGLSYTIGGWDNLSPVGVMDDADGGWLELRNCTCGSTISRPIGKSPSVVERVRKLHRVHKMMPPTMPEEFRSVLAKGMIDAFAE